MSRRSRKKKNVGLLGPPTLANLLDWLVTLGLGTIVGLVTLRLGGVQPGTQAELLPLFCAVLILHGLWVAVQDRTSFQLSAVPFLFVPFGVWACLSVLFLTPAHWRGGYELISWAGAFVFFWVAVNNLRTRAHLWALLLSVVLSAGVAFYTAFYQFFQDRAYLADAGVPLALRLDPGYFGRSTGVFADPHSFAAYALMLLPGFMVAAVVPRFPVVLRVFCFYVGLIIVAAITLAQSYWAVSMVAVLMVLVPFFCFRKQRTRLTVALLGLGLAAAVFIGMYVANPLFKSGFERALTAEGEGVRLLLWREAMSATLERPFAGQGAGAYPMVLEQSRSGALPFTATTPHNDFLLILSQYGLVGAGLFFGPLFFVLYRAFRAWAAERFSQKVKGSGQRAKMPAQKFFLSFALSGLLGAGLAAFFGFLFHVPALLLLVVVLLSVCVKSCFGREVALPQFRFAGWLYALGVSAAGLLFVTHGGVKLESQSLALRAGQQLDHLVRQQVPIVGSPVHLDRVITLFEKALLADPENVDAWLGLSAAIGQTHFRNPAAFEQTGDRALAAARRALELCPDYWLAHAQVGIAQALSGDAAAAEGSLARALEMAPNSSNANYYYAALLSIHRETREAALAYVTRALEINPDNRAARRLQQRLFIL